jgi:chemotaxis protein histidine kinase CheA
MFDDITEEEFESYQEHSEKFITNLLELMDKARDLPNDETWEEINRTLHSLKGVSALFQMNEVVSQIHKIESSVIDCRDHVNIDTCIEILDKLITQIKSAKFEDINLK